MSCTIFCTARKKKKENSEKTRKVRGGSPIVSWCLWASVLALPLNVAGTQQKETVVREREGKGREWECQRARLWMSLIVCVNAANVPAPIFYAHKCSQERRLPSPLPPLSLSSSRSVSSHPSQVHCICILSQFSYCPVRCSVLWPLGIFFVLFHHIHQQTLLIRHVRQQGNSSTQLMCPPSSSFYLPLSLSVLGFLTSHS